MIVRSITLQMLFIFFVFGCDDSTSSSSDTVRTSGEEITGGDDQGGLSAGTESPAGQLGHALVQGE